MNRVSEKENQIPSLYAWLGGAEVQNALMAKFYERVSADELLRPLFGDMPADHPRQVADFVGEVLGGSQAYTLRRGGHATMLAHHFGKNISEAQRRRRVNLLLDSADEIRLPGDPEFRSALVAYLEWGSRLALMNLKLPAETAADPATPVPHWSWGVPSGPCEPEQESRVSAAQRVLARTLLSLV